MSSHDARRTPFEEQTPEPTASGEAPPIALVCEAGWIEAVLDIAVDHPLPAPLIGQRKGWDRGGQQADAVGEWYLFNNRARSIEEVGASEAIRDVVNIEVKGLTLKPLNLTVHVHARLNHPGDFAEDFRAHFVTDDQYLPALLIPVHPLYPPPNGGQHLGI